ncbi:arginyl-tRNA synthetase [Thermoplasmatales archaeon BRNA1]|nr:arginyl-tRNA synthetase [Thermoplasmatales archaeon BRNA1]
MKVLTQFEKECEDAVVKALADMGAPAGLKIVKEIPDNADLAIPCFTFSKALKNAPVKIAEEIASRIQVPCGLIAGLTALNGYLNFTADPSAIVSDVLTEIGSAGRDFGKSAPTGIRVNVEHTSTNPTGPVHVGRARNPIIGDTLARCLRMRGHDVTTEYYVNDVGKQVVTLAWGVANVTEEEVEQEIAETNTADERDKVDHRLVYNYRVATKKIHGNAEKGIPANPELEGQIADMMRRFENGDREVIDYVGKVARTMLGGINETLAAMNVALDKYTWESAIIAGGAAKDIVSKLDASKYAGQSEDGAHFVDLKDFGIHGKNTKFTYTRADGTTLYTTRDLAYHEDKFSRSDRIIDVLGEDQKLGSQQLCAALEIMGEQKRPEPLFYAFVSLPEGRMSTRKGVVVYLDDLIDEATDRAYEEIKKRRNDLSEEKMRTIARAIGVGAVRYNIVKVGADKQFVFKWEDALSFDGNSGPYLQYVHARACSILAKAGDFQRDTDGSKLTDEFEVKLAKVLAKYEGILKQIDETKKVNLMPAYGHEVAAAFNQFYVNVNVLNSGDAKNARLTLVECTKFVLASVLDCLGMEAPEEM